MLGLTVQHQTQRNWCWAACSSSTSGFFDPGSTWTQCELANAELDQTTCCADGSTSACDKPWYLDRALTQTGNFASRTEGPITWEDVQSEIDAGRPVCARIGWQGGGGHFVIIVGYSEEALGRLLNVEDPWTGSSSVEFNEFAHQYQSQGIWTHTYLTKA